MEITSPEITLLAITPEAEKVIETAGRTCYLSQDRITDESAPAFIKRLVNSGHHSVLEHASATFRIKGASRSFTHQIVRHRLSSFSQQSQRYVNESEFDYIIPPSILENEQAAVLFREFMNKSAECYRALRQMDILKEDARFVLPNALESEIVMTANFRELRHIFNLRLAKKAQWEIRKVCLDMLLLLQDRAPAVFGDYVIDFEAITATSPNSNI